MSDPCEPGQFEASFYLTSSGRSPVEDYLDGLEKKARTKCWDYIELLVKRGFSLPRSHLEKVQGEQRMWALRPEWEGVEHRLFFTRVGHEFVFVHAVPKKADKFSPRDLRTARQRIREVQEDYESTG